MTPEEREEWLRCRSKPPPQSSSSTADSTTTSSSVIQFVLVPHDNSKPLQTLYLPKDDAANNEKSLPSGDALPEFVRPYFADQKTVDADVLKQQAAKQFAGHPLEQQMANDTNNKLNTAAMNAVAARGSVETFPLVHPADTNNFTGVYIYLDEMGLLKKLPTNSRATSMAVACGYSPPPKFYGDVFIGRVQTKPKFTNVDFVAGKDTDGNAQWMQRAVAENLAWQQELNNVTNNNNNNKSDSIGTDGKEAKEEQFTWTQDEEEIELKVPIITTTTNEKVDKKAIQVSFLTGSITVKYQGVERLKVPLYGSIDVDACTWTLEGGNVLVITCEKNQSGELWPRVHKSQE